MNPYKTAVSELQIAKTIEKAIQELEKKSDEDPNFVHMNIEMLDETINVLLKLKGTLQKSVI